MPSIDPQTDCKHKALNVKNAINSLIIDEFQNEFLLDTYLNALKEAQLAVEILKENRKSEDFSKSESNKDQSAGFIWIRR